MRKSIQATVVGVALSVFGLGQITAALAADGLTVENTNGVVSIAAVYSAVAGSDDPWVSATMGSDIGPGEQSTFTIGTNGGCLYDIKVRFTDGAEQTFDGVNVCRGDRVIAA